MRLEREQGARCKGAAFFSWIVIRSREWPAIINLQPDLAVCGEAQDASTALKLAQQLRPDAVIVDINLRRGDGLAFTKALTATVSPPPIPVLVFSAPDEAYYAERALRAGAMGYVMQHEPPRKCSRPSGSY